MQTCPAHQSCWGQRPGAPSSLGAPLQREVALPTRTEVQRCMKGEDNVRYVAVYGNLSFDELVDELARFLGNVRRQEVLGPSEGKALISVSQDRLACRQLAQISNTILWLHQI